MEILEYYNWWFPGCPVRVQIGLRVVVEQLQRRIQPATDGPAELEEGVLLGSVTSDGISITDFAPLFLIRELPKAEAISALTKKRGHQMLLGYYRTCQEEDLRLNEDDLALAEAAFGEPHHVFLLIRATGPSPATATFFFRDSATNSGRGRIPGLPFRRATTGRRQGAADKTDATAGTLTGANSHGYGDRSFGPGDDSFGPGDGSFGPSADPGSPHQIRRARAPDQEGPQARCIVAIAVGIIAALVALGVPRPRQGTLLATAPKNLERDLFGIAGGGGER